MTTLHVFMAAHLTKKQMKIILKGYIEVPESESLLISRELIRHIELTRNEPGCIAFSVKQDRVNPNKYNVYEEFIDKEAFDMHQQRVENSSWGKVSKNVIRNYTINST